MPDLLVTAAETRLMPTMKVSRAHLHILYNIYYIIYCTLYNILKVSRAHQGSVAKGRNQWQKALIRSSTVKSAVKTMLPLSGSGMHNYKTATGTVVEQGGKDEIMISARTWQAKD